MRGKAMAYLKAIYQQLYSSQYNVERLALQSEFNGVAGFSKYTGLITEKEFEKMTSDVSMIVKELARKGGA